MKYIKKSESPQFFYNLKNNARKTNLNWDEFSKRHLNVKQKLKEVLIDEQNNLCAYCEVYIKVDNSHIEHIKDRSHYPQDTFNYNNLILSCNSKDSCGHKKCTSYFLGFVSPLNLDCEKKFTYTMNGRIIPTQKSDCNAQKTIEILGLNSKKLIDRRYSIIKALEEFDNDDLNYYLDNYIDCCHGFFTVIKYMKDKI